MLRSFLALEAAGGIILIAAAACAMIVANSGLSDAYSGAFHAQWGGLSLLHWINDGLMALFFLLVGLEIKREATDGQLARRSDRILPGVAAVAGAALPALIYAGLNLGEGGAMRGWAIPAATDIAFALGILALLGRRVPTSLKIFLTAVAIIDDLIAVLVIAIFYTVKLDLAALAGAALCLAGLVALNRRGVQALWPYLALGAAVWFLVLQSGIHATLAGVAVAMTIPLTKSPGRPDDSRSPLYRLERGLHPWVAYAIVPLFGFANAGVPLRGFSASDLLSPVPAGIALGLFLGKQVGIFGAVRLLVAANLAQRPSGASWLQIYGVALLCGIGFTMSLFIGGLAFGEGSHQNDAAKLGILLGSTLAAAAGFLVLRLAPSAPRM